MTCKCPSCESWRHLQSPPSQSLHFSCHKFLFDSFAWFEVWMSTCRLHETWNEDLGLASSECMLVIIQPSKHIERIFYLLLASKRISFLFLVFLFFIFGERISCSLLYCWVSIKRNKHLKITTQTNAF